VPKLILNRDLTPADVPTARYAELDPPDGGHRVAWRALWRFALTFDPVAYAKHAGTQFDEEALVKRAEGQLADGGQVAGGFVELRAILTWLYGIGGQGVAISTDRAHLIDAVLDAIYADVSGGNPRPRGEPGPYEPGLGTFAGSVPGSGQHRFWFAAHDGLNRMSLYDGVAGLFLRELAESMVVSALYLYPPAYPIESDGRAVHIFMVMLELRSDWRGDTRTLEDEYERLTLLAVRRFADPRHDHHPEVGQPASGR
jgi:hypothetical protein